MITQSKPLGFRQRIAKAETAEEVNGLLGEAFNLKPDYASAHTKQRWVNTAKRRKKQLGAK